MDLNFSDIMIRTGYVWDRGERHSTYRRLTLLQAKKRAGKTLKSAGKVAKGARPVFLASPAGLVLTNPKVSGFQLVINPKTFGLDGIDLGLQYTFSESDFI